MSDGLIGLVRRIRSQIQTVPANEENEKSPPPVAGAPGGGGTGHEINELNEISQKRVANSCSSPQAVYEIRPDPALPTTWCGRDAKGKPLPGGDLPPGQPLPPHATFWKQGKTAWVPVDRPRQVMQSPDRGSGHTPPSGRRERRDRRPLGQAGLFQDQMPPD